MKARVEVLPRAVADAARIDAWWRANRIGSPALFRKELRRALVLLSGAPSLGAHYDGTSVPGLRRYCIRRTQHHVYYVLDEGTRRLRVVALGNAAGERAPGSLTSTIHPDFWEVPVTSLDRPSRMGLDGQLTVINPPCDAPNGGSP